jgi:hypothetical protein
MGKPTSLLVPERERTKGSETSQYLQEKKSIEIPLVVASESGTGQTLNINLFGGL